MCPLAYCCAPSDTSRTAASDHTCNSHNSTGNYCFVLGHIYAFAIVSKDREHEDLRTDEELWESLASWSK